MSQREMRNPISIVLLPFLGMSLLILGTGLAVAQLGALIYKPVSKRVDALSQPQCLSIVSVPAGMSAVDVEREITRRLESELGGLPGVVQVRSISTVGLSVVTLHGIGPLIFPLRLAVEQRLHALKSSYFLAGPHIDPRLLPTGGPVPEDVRAAQAWLEDNLAVPTLEIAGSDLVLAEQILGRAANLLHDLPGVFRMESPRTFGPTGLSILADPGQMSGYGISFDTLAHALAPFHARPRHSNELHIPMAASSPSVAEQILAMRLPALDGRQIEVAQIAAVVESVDPVRIFHRDGQRLIWVRLHPANQEVWRIARQRLATVEIPIGFSLALSGMAGPG
jgi:Cu/Ag efflux pump CusA